MAFSLHRALPPLLVFVVMATLGKSPPALAGEGPPSAGVQGSVQPLLGGGLFASPSFGVASYLEAGAEMPLGREGKRGNLSLVGRGGRGSRIYFTDTAHEEPIQWGEFTVSLSWSLPLLDKVFGTGGVTAFAGVLALPGEADMPVWEELPTYGAGGFARIGIVRGVFFDFRADVRVIHHPDGLDFTIPWGFGISLMPLHQL